MSENELSEEETRFIPATPVVYRNVNLEGKLPNESNQKEPVELNTKE